MSGLSGMRPFLISTQHTNIAIPGGALESRRLIRDDQSRWLLYVLREASVEKHVSRCVTRPRCNCLFGISFCKRRKGANRTSTAFHLSAIFTNSRNLALRSTFPVPILLTVFDTTAVI